MEIIFLPSAEQDLAYWVKTGNKVVLKKIAALLEDVLKHPYSGIGKPEALKYEMLGSWSRRITLEHRLVYEVLSDEIVEVQSARGHY
ncbi:MULTISPECIES: Txe/YoeB family addiction module toxin [unclassified Flavobacterium]|jgi:toxin YoeB|uniref:Txe/YoeB family addiction module toxin n=1 Tax=unclassified Flavobacterium TaxID=196869 RepID=UPI0025C6AD21|nr:MULTISPECIES: Txe/YoeB family addiction module toxin [unclassified Flavobacterium]